MTVYSWPDTRAFQPQGQELRVIDNTQRTVESSLSGYVQTNAMPGARWGWAFDMAPDTRADRAALEAYLLRLNGRQHRVPLWDLRNPRPRGTIGLSGVTLAATAAQFATTLSLTGARSRNLLASGSFEVDANADGIADGWAAFSSGTTGTVTRSLFGGGLAGAYAQRVDTTGLGTTSGDQAGVFQDVPVAAYVGAVMSLQAYMGLFGATINGQVAIAWLDAGGSPLSVSSSAITALSTGWTPLAVSATVPAGCVTARIILVGMQRAATAGATTLYIDCAQFERADAPTPFADPPTLAAGDWLGLAGGQLVRVVVDAAANDAGAMTVEVRHMLRKAVASGSAVTLDKPTALYVRTEAGLALPRMAGSLEPGLSIDLVEVFA